MSQSLSAIHLVREVLSLERVQLDDYAETKLLDEQRLELLKDDNFSLSSLQLQVSNCGSGGIREADYSSDDPLRVGIERGIFASRPIFFGLSESCFSEGPTPRVSYLTAIVLAREGDRQPEDDSAALREHFRENHSIPPGSAKTLTQLVDEGVMRLDGIHSEPIWNIDLPAASFNPGDSYVLECWVIHKDTPFVRRTIVGLQTG